MEMRPPCMIPVNTSCPIALAEGKNTHDVVVLAAHCSGRALVAGSDADDGDGRAVEADEGVDALEDNAEQAEEERRGGTAGLLCVHG